MGAERGQGGVGAVPTRPLPSAAMATKRPNKQERQRQNRQQRDARKARSVHAGEATAISRGERESAQPISTSRAFGKAGPGTEASGKGAAKGGRASRSPIPGQRALVMAILFTLLSAITSRDPPGLGHRAAAPLNPGP